MHKVVGLNKLVPNPFRKMERYPIREEKIEMLMDSMGRTGFWDNVVGREQNGRVELAYGHHRWIAFKRKFGKRAKMNIIIRSLSDEDMLRVMADENANEYGTSAEVEQETIRAVVEAYAEGKIKLPKPSVKTKKQYIRYAPGFRQGCVPRSGTHTYTSLTIAQFLGWFKKGGKEANDHVLLPLAFLEAAENELVDEEDCENLTSRQAEEISRGAVGINQSYERAAKTIADPVEQKEVRARGKRVARHAAKSAAKAMKPDPKTGRSKVTIESTQYAMERSRKPGPKEIPPVEKFVLKLAGDLGRVLSPDNPRWMGLREVAKYAGDLEERTKKNLTVALERIIDRCQAMIDAIDGSSPKLK